MKKSYRFQFDVLQKTLDKEANKEAFLSQSKVLKEAYEKRGDDYLKKEIERCEEWSPFILLDEARQVLWTKLDRFYFVCTESFCEGCKKKRHRYYQFVQAAVLFEILYLEFIQEPLHEHVQKGNDLVKLVQGETADLDSTVKQLQNARGDIAVVEHFNQSISKYGQAIAELEKEINLVNLFSLLEAEFAGDLCAMYHLLMIMEAVNVHEDNSSSDMQRATQIEAEFTSKYEKCFEAFERTNEDKRACYRRVNEHMEMVLSKYADKNYDVAKNVVNFLEELKKKEKRRKRLIMRST